MSWIDEIGEKKLTEHEIKVVSSAVTFFSELDEQDENDIRKGFIEACDTAIHNLNNLKKQLEEGIKPDGNKKED